VSALGYRVDGADGDLKKITSVPRITYIKCVKNTNTYWLQPVLRGGVFRVILGRSVACFEPILVRNWAVPVQFFSACDRATRSAALLPLRLAGGESSPISDSFPLDSTFFFGDFSPKSLPADS
jgi:hypothetical protein